MSQLPAEASRIRAELNELEAALASDRREMRLGYENGKGEFVEASTVQLRQVLRSSADEREREAAWKGLRSIGPHVAEKFAEIVKKRNAMARAVSSENEVREFFSFLIEALLAKAQALAELSEEKESAAAPPPPSSAHPPFAAEFDAAVDDLRAGSDEKDSRAARLYSLREERAGRPALALRLLDKALAAAAGEAAASATRPPTAADAAAKARLERFVWVHAAEAAREREEEEGNLHSLSPFFPPPAATKQKQKQDFYDFKARATEAMTKKELFEILDDLERKTRPLAVAARERLSAAKGAGALKPWNRPAALAGESERALDPYFAFEDAVSVWARSFAALGVDFGGGASTLVLDLCDRKGKYSNGFCHWPKLSSVSVLGERLSAEARLSSLATPDAVGSGALNAFFPLRFPLSLSTSLFSHLKEEKTKT